ncbi:MAG: hypothetical protein Q8L48_03545 [Archangium sp.]|nr:hypothetical protein [Archangium sp.]
MQPGDEDLKAIRAAVLAAVVSRVGTHQPSEQTLSLEKFSLRADGAWELAVSYFEDPDWHAQYDERVWFTGHAVVACGPGTARVVSGEITCTEGNYRGGVGKTSSLV